MTPEDNPYSGPDTQESAVDTTTLERILDLPYELLSSILDVLDYTDIFKLATTCTVMYRLIPTRQTSVPFVFTNHNLHKSMVFPQKFATHCKVDLQVNQVGFSDIFKTKLYKFKSFSNMDISTCGILTKRTSRMLLKNLTVLEERVNLSVSLEQALELLPMVKNKNVYTSRSLVLNVTIPMLISRSPVKATNMQTVSTTTTTTSNEAFGVTTMVKATSNERAGATASTATIVPNETFGATRITTTAETAMHDQYEHLKNIETPQNIRKHYYEMKDLAWRAGAAKKRRIDIDTNLTAATAATATPTIVPLSSLKIIESNTSYVNDDTEADLEKMPPNAAPISFEEANIFVKEYASLYLESFVMFEDYYIYPISIDAFWHNNSTLDDCADAATTIYSTSAQAIIKEHKATTGAYYYEASIKIGYVELVFTGGFIGSSTHYTITPFLGSSIGCLPLSLKVGNKRADIIKRRLSTAKYVSTNRHLRQYSKIGANYRWSLQSIRHVLQGLYPLNPLYYKNHVAFGTTQKATIHSLAAGIINAITKLSISKDVIKNLLRVTKKLMEYKKYIRGVNSFAKLQANIDQQESTGAKTSNYKYRIVECLKILEAAANQVDGNIELVEIEIRNKALEMMNSGYSNALTSGNQKVCELFAKNHPVIFQIQE
ncbi:hypothetical protein INT45_000722 [Circinella minor]|uniref:F-box domain-containing protein n=1 Tax=Circinella minor TaxID=1195481 RepID=A0A8H7RLU1_9FUNG|nr:hypothetical protein INT45_000722 [Circinella minor]